MIVVLLFHGMSGITQAYGMVIGVAMGMGEMATRTLVAGIGWDLGVSGGGDLERERDLDLGSGGVRTRDRWVCGLVRGLGSG